MKSELSKYKEAMAVAMDELTRRDSHTSIITCEMGTAAALAKIKAILNPPPAMEEVEVVRWECVKCGEVRTTDPTSRLCLCFTVGMNPAEWQYIKLTGKVLRPVPQKVERSVSAVFVADAVGDLLSPCGNYWVNRGVLGKALREGQAATVTVAWEELA